MGNLVNLYAPNVNKSPLFARRSLELFLIVIRAEGDNIIALFHNTIKMFNNRNRIYY